MKKNNWLIVIFLFFVMFSCDCEDIVEKEHYTDGKIMSKSIFNCDREIKNYEYFSINAYTIFTVDYIELPKHESVKGYPWAHIIWDQEKYLIGDTIELLVDVVVPPKFDLKLTINGDEINQKEILKQGMKVYKYRKIREDKEDNIYLKADFYFEEKKWITYKRTLPIDRFATDEK